MQARACSRGKEIPEYHGEGRDKVNFMVPQNASVKCVAFQCRDISTAIERAELRSTNSQGRLSLQQSRLVRRGSNPSAFLFAHGGAEFVHDFPASHNRGRVLVRLERDGAYASVAAPAVALANLG